MHRSEYEAHLTSILKDTPQIMEVLRIVRETHLPNWYVGAGAIRNAVWDTFHGKTEPLLSETLIASTILRLTLTRSQ